MTDPKRILRELIALPSVNPAFLPKGDPHAGEARVAEFLAHWAGKAGCEVEHQAVLPGRSNLLIRLAPAGGGKVRDRILLAPHMDTVGGKEIPGRLFDPVEKNGRLHGRGACDTKGSVAAMFAAFLDLARSKQRPRSTEIVFAGLVDEESTQAGSRVLAGCGMKVRLAVVGEPTGLSVVTAHKGDLWLRLETRGKAAHGARPELGKNAIHEMARVVDVLETGYGRMIGRKRHRLLGRATINVGQIEGGRQPNIVPDRCRIRVDRRTLPGEKDAVVKREMMAHLKREGLRVWMGDTKGVPSLPLETDPRHPWVRALMKEAGQKGPRGVDYFSDAGVLAAGGIPSVLFGPGDIAQAHTEDEWVRVSQLVKARAVLSGYLMGLP